MRLRPALALLPSLLLSAACAPAPIEQSGASHAALSGSCTSSREQILASTSAARSQAITRGFGWLDANVPYSQAKSFEGYRTDCSGFVSMCWELGTSTNTATLYATGTYDSDLGSWDELLPADAIVRQGHVVLFLGWEPDKSGVCVLEQASTASDMQFRVRSVASLQSQGFKPIRATGLAGDTSATTPATPAGADPTAPADPTVPSDPSTTPADPATCVSPAELDVCNAAKLTAGVTCGPVVDACGKTVDCALVPGFGCGSSCQPGLAQDLCGHEKAARGVQCGVISNGCGGTLSCDAVPGFGCTNGNKCTASHRCEKADTTAAPAIPDQPAASGTVPPVGDTGDSTTAATADTTGATDPSTSTGASAKKSLPKATTAGTASSGCSASSSRSAGAAGGDALPFLGLALALSIGRRRSRRRD